MGTIASTRRGRPRKAVSDDKVTGQGSHEPANGNGDGEIGGNGTQQIAKDSVSSKKVDWRGLVDLVVAHNAFPRNDLISRVWHPNGEGLSWKETSKFIGTNCADVPVLFGESAYQLSTGEIITI